MIPRWSSAATLAAAVLLPASAVHADGAFPDSDSIMVPDALPDEIVLGTNFGVVLSTDGGRTWSWTCEQANDAFGSHYQMGAPPLDRIYASARAGGTGALVYSDDATCSWQVAAGGLAGVPVLDAFPDPTDAQRVLALLTRAGDAGSTYEAWASADGGATFGSRLYATADQLTGVESARADPDTVYLSLLAAGDGGAVPELARSTDGGAHWQLHDLSAGLGPGVANLRIIAVDPQDAATVLLRVSGGAAGEVVAATADGGATVTPRLTFAGGVVSAFARLPNGDLIAGGTSGQDPVAFRSADGGMTFQPLPAPPHLRALAARGTRLYGVADNYMDGYAVGTSDDEGMTWQPLVSFGGDPDAPGVASVGAIAACVSAVCESDCLTRAGMGQWAPDVCTAAPAPDGGSARDASPDAPAGRPDAAP
ncbi:MAG TPA: hypothetical protein VHO06_24040, partial [Polyangia bacterium]|nr:hypothetical protein [Polyangia bacterium]